MSDREKDRILTTSPTKTPPFLRNITIIARLSTLATLAGTCKTAHSGVGSKLKGGAILIRNLDKQRKRGGGGGGNGYV